MEKAADVNLKEEWQQRLKAIEASLMEREKAVAKREAAVQKSEEALHQQLQQLHKISLLFRERFGIWFSFPCQSQNESIDPATVKKSEKEELSLHEIGRDLEKACLLIWLYYFSLSSCTFFCLPVAVVFLL
jgi:hypothetical protein